MKLAQVTIRVPNDVLRWLEDTAAARGVPTAAVAREILERAKARCDLPGMTGVEVVHEVEVKAENETREKLGVDFTALHTQLANLQRERDRLWTKARDAVTPEIAEAIQDRIREIENEAAGVKDKIDAYEKQRETLRASFACDEIQRLVPLLEEIVDELAQIIATISSLAVVVGDPAIPAIAWSSALERIRQKVPNLGIGGNLFRTGDVLTDLRRGSPQFARAASR